MNNINKLLKTHTQTSPQMLFEPYSQEQRLLLYFWREWGHNV